MTAFTFRLEHRDGTPVEPPSFRTAVPNWQTGDEIPLTGVEWMVEGEAHHHAEPVRVGELQVWDVVNETKMDQPSISTASSSRSSP